MPGDEIPDDEIPGDETPVWPRVSESERRRRWRLVLGSAAEGALDDADGASPDGGSGRGADAASAAARGGSGGPGLTGDDVAVDAALALLYDRPGDDGRRGASSGRRGGGLGRSKPGVVRWLGRR